MDRLEAIGRVSMPLAALDGNVTVSMKIVLHP
jgi:hypothetical protein